MKNIMTMSRFELVEELRKYTTKRELDVILKSDTAFMRGQLATYASSAADKNDAPYQWPKPEAKRAGCGHSHEEHEAMMRKVFEDLPFGKSTRKAVMEFQGIPVYVSKHAPKDRVYLGHDTARGLDRSVMIEIKNGVPRIVQIPRTRKGLFG